MEAAIDPNISKSALWTGRVLSTLIVLFMLFDGITKIARSAATVAAFTKAGYGAGIVAVIGALALLSAILYAIPQTAVLGAIVLTGYLGGATDSVVHLGQPPVWWLPVAFGVLAWFGLYLRDPRLRQLVPFRR